MSTSIILNYFPIEEISNLSEDSSVLIPKIDYREHYEMQLFCHNDSPRLNWTRWTEMKDQVEVQLSVTANANSEHNVAYSISNVDVWTPCTTNNTISWDITGYSCIYHYRTESLDINTVTTIQFTGRLIANTDEIVFSTPLYLLNEEE